MTQNEGSSEDEQYRAYKRFLKQNVGTVVEDLETRDERLRLSSHRYSEEHPTVVEAAFWIRQDRPEGSSKYKTVIIRDLNDSIVTDGGYAETREEAIEWIEEKAQRYDGEPLNWEERKRKAVRPDELAEEQSTMSDRDTEDEPRKHYCHDIDEHVEVQEGETESEQE
jgi:hypothetical protein